MAEDYWGNGYWGTGYWATGYWGQGGTPIPPAPPPKILVDAQQSWRLRKRMKDESPTIDDDVAMLLILINR